MTGAFSSCGRIEDSGDRLRDAGADAGRSCPVEMCRPYGCNPRTARCLTVCESTPDCARDFVCDRGFCVGTDCTAETAAVRCGGYACVGGQCSRDCSLGPCSPGFYCRGDTGQCLRRCTTRDDVTCGGYVCDVGSGECEPYCLDGELECAPGYLCRAMACEPDGG